MSAAEPRGVISGRELDALFQDFSDYSRILLAVSGGPDSTALLWLAARWRDARKNAPKLIAATVDHRLRPEAKQEAAQVAKLARKLKIPHHVLSWRGKKPKTGLPEAARAARYELLISLARKTGAEAIVTAHTRDDQAETMLHRIGRGSGVTGLAGIRRKSERDGVVILRPLLGLPKARLESRPPQGRDFFRGRSDEHRSRSFYVRVCVSLRRCSRKRGSIPRGCRYSQNASRGRNRPSRRRCRSAAARGASLERKLRAL